jgi:hypothetical protein
MKTDQQLMDEFFATHRYDKTPRDWRDVPETSEDPDEAEKIEKRLSELLRKALA